MKELEQHFKVFKVFKALWSFVRYGTMSYP
jgi:hypothetical protein